MPQKEGVLVLLLYHYALRLQLGKLLNYNWVGWFDWMTSTFSFMAFHVDHNMSLLYVKVYYNAHVRPSHSFYFAMVVHNE